MDVSPLLLHLSGVKADESLTNLSKEEERIIEAMYGVDLRNSNELRRAAEKLRDMDGAKIVKCILDHWRPEYLIGGIANLEKVFWETIELGGVIAKFFSDNERWRSNEYDVRWLNQFNLLSGHSISVDDVTENIDTDYLINSHAYGPGLAGFFKFVMKNNGNPKKLIQKIAPEVERLQNPDIEDVVCLMAPYIEEGDIDARKMFPRVDWDSVKQYDEMKEFTDFFSRHAPELVAQIPS